MLQPLALCAAFWVAVLGFRARSDARFARRFPLALGLAALAAHLGWALLHARDVAQLPAALLAPVGFCVLFVPLGLLGAAPWRRGREERDAFLGAAFGSLPLALATARIGCAAAHCCGPLAALALDAAAMLALHAFVRGARVERIAPLMLMGIGAARLAIEPLRAPPPLGPPLVPAAWLAAVWLAIGGAWIAHCSRGGLATSSCDVCAKTPLRST
jgi:hypothetical protein